MLKGKAIRNYVFSYAEKSIAALNKWNAGENNSHGTIVSYTDIHGNYVEKEGIMSISGGGIGQRDPSGDCTNPTGCAELSFDSYSGFTHYFNDCFDVKESELRAETNGRKQNDSINERIGRLLHDRLVNYKLNLALVAVIAAIESNEDAVLESGEWNSEAFEELSEKFGLSEDALKTLVMYYTEANKFTKGCSVNNCFTYGKCQYLKGDFSTNGKFLFKTADQVMKDKALLLVEGAMDIVDIEELQVKIMETGKAGNVCYNISYAGAVEIKILGYNFDDTLAKNPSLAVVGASENWTVVGDLETTAGVMWKKA